MITADKILDLVCEEFKVDPAIMPETIKFHDMKLARIRRIYWYLCRLYLPVMIQHGGFAKPKLQEGAFRGVARVLGVSPETVRKACIEVEDRRDDPEFDAQLERLEKSLSI